MTKNDDGFSLIIVVIFMSIAALFIGYLMGSWLISFLVDDEQVERAQNNQKISQRQNPIPEAKKETAAKKVNNSSNNLTAPQQKTEKAENKAVEKKKEPVKETAVEKKENKEPAPAENSAAEPNNQKQKKLEPGNFGVQIGAFSNYSNALTIKEKIEKMGYQVIVTDGSPHQVQVTGYPDRSRAEAAAAELEKEGYPGFIVSRE